MKNLFAYYLLILGADLFARGATAQDESRQQQRRLEKQRIRTKLQQHAHALSRESEDTPHESTSMITIIGTEPAAFVSQNKTTVKSVKYQQELIFQQVKRRFPDAQKVASVTKLVNAIFIDIPDLQDLEYYDLLDIPGIQSVRPHLTYEVNLNSTVQTIQGNVAHQPPYCTTGRGVRVAILDTGVDYTHVALGGIGTVKAYESAFGTRLNSPRNRRRDGLFPTARVYDGYDFVGDGPVPRADNDPIDGKGHGTFVASNVLAVAPDARILAVKVCSSYCPEMAILQGLEYAVDPEDEDNANRAVDIINMSFGSPALPAYYSTVTAAVEAAFSLGVLSVVSFGNAGNRPFISGGFADTPNVLSVGATGHPTQPNFGKMEGYSSRGPGANSQLKPDISAISGSRAAAAGTGNGWRRVSGTSFSAPITAGAAALIKQQCSACSPLAIKSILMNNAYRQVGGGNGRLHAPLSWVGAGEVRIKNALDADFWAYSPDNNNVQPSISLGVINAADDSVIDRRIRIRSLTEKTEALDLSVAWRDPADGASKAVTISFDNAVVQVDGCNKEKDVTVSFLIDASKTPNNFLSTQRDPLALDRNEFDGHILLRSRESEKTIGIPFHMILRKASKVSLSSNTFQLPNIDETALHVTLRNSGSGVAQVDAYQLLYVSDDDREPVFGVPNAPADMRSVGYRTVMVENTRGCTNMVEFAVNFWERPQHVIPTFIIVAIEIEGKSESTFLVSTTRDLVNAESFVIDDENKIRCTGLAADHGVSSGNVILRACTEHLDMAPQDTISVAFSTYAWPGGTVSDSTRWFTINVPNAVFAAPSRDILPGQAMDMTISYKELDDGVDNALGVQFITNAYRRATSTGAATRETETLLFSRKEVIVPSELTPDILDFPDADEFRGPRCQWRDTACIAPPTRSPSQIPPLIMLTDFPTREREQTETPETADPITPPSCPPNAVPRSPIPLQICFDGSSIVVTDEKGVTQMQHLRIGDMVLVKDGYFEPVYSFGHYDSSSHGNFLRISVSSKSALTISREHMLFVRSKNFIPASLVRIGDELLDASGASTKVERIESVVSQGLFAPFTPSGQLVINGIVVSSFVAMEKSAGLHIAGGLHISFQWLAHAFEFPHRLACYHLSRGCPNERYSKGGISTWVQTSFRWSQWLLNQSHTVKNPVLVAILGVAVGFVLIEACLLNPMLLLIPACMLVAFRLVSKRRKSSS